MCLLATVLVRPILDGCIIFYKLDDVSAILNVLKCQKYSNVFVEHIGLIAVATLKLEKNIKFMVYSKSSSK